MTDIKFNRIKVFALPKRDVIEPWLVAVEQFGDASHLKLVAQGTWTPMSGLGPCTPDGLLTPSVPDTSLILTDCPAGALIGRIGGSSASLKSAAPETGDSKPFAVGSHAVIKLPDGAVGPLFLGFNILIRPLKLETLEVEILGGKK